MAAGAKGDKIWKELRILHAENIYAILDPQARGSVDVRSAVEELVSGRLVSSLDVANAVIGAATQHAQSLGFTDISRIPRAAFIRAVLEVPSEWLSLSYGGTIPAVRSESQLASMSTSAGDTSWHVQPKRLGGGGRAAASEFPWREDQENIDGLRQSLAQARQLGLELVSKINFAGTGTTGGTPPRRIPTQASAPRAARSTATSRNTSTPGRFAAKYADGADSLWPEDTGLMSALERVADNEFRSETWRAREARSTARKVEKAREALRLAERDGLEAARRIEEAQARLRLQEKNGWKCALRTEPEARTSDDQNPLSSTSKTGGRKKVARSASPVSSLQARAAARQEEKIPSQKTASARDASPAPSWTARSASGGQKSRGAALRSTWSESSSEEDGFKMEDNLQEAEDPSPSKSRENGSPTLGARSTSSDSTRKAASSPGASEKSVADRVQNARRSPTVPREQRRKGHNDLEGHADAEDVLKQAYALHGKRISLKMQAKKKRGEMLREERKLEGSSFAGPRKFLPANSSQFKEFTGIERFNHLGFANSLRSDGMSMDDWAEKKAPPSFRTPAVFEPFGEPGLDDEEEEQRATRPRSTTPRLATQSASPKTTPRTPRSVSPNTPRSRSVSFSSQLRTPIQGRGTGRAGRKGGRARGARQAQRDNWNMDFSDQLKDKRVLPSARLYA